MSLGSIQGAVSKERMPLGRLQRGCQRKQTNSISKEDAVGQLTMMMPEASDKGSQPYSRAFRHREMAGMGLPPII